jgi:hypothetical protein
MIPSTSAGGGRISPSSAIADVAPSPIAKKVPSSAIEPIMARRYAPSIMNFEIRGEYSAELTPALWDGLSKKFIIGRVQILKRSPTPSFSD